MGVNGACLFDGAFERVEAFGDVEGANGGAGGWTLGGLVGAGDDGLS